MDFSRGSAALAGSLVHGVGKSAAWKYVSLAAAMLVTLHFVYFSFMRPPIDWDVVGYTIATLKGGRFVKDGVLDVVALHAATWAAMEPFMDAQLREYMAEGSFRQAAMNDPVALASHLPLYESKYGYVVLLKALSLVMSPVRASIVVALVGSIVMLWMLVGAGWKLEGIGTLFWMPIVLLLKLSSFAGMTTPDAICAALTVAGVFLLLAGHVRAGVAVLLVAAFVRPDALIQNGLLAGALLLRQRYGAAAVLTLGSVALYQFDMAMGSHVGWWKQFHYTFYGMPDSMVGHEPAFSVEKYRAILLFQLEQVARMPWAQAGLGLLLGACYLASRERDPWPGLLALALIAGLAVRFLIYPSSEIRLHMPQLFSLAVLFLWMASRRSPNAS